MGSLESRGFITEGEQSTQSNDPFFTSKGAMKIAKTEMLHALPRFIGVHCKSL